MVDSNPPAPAAPQRVDPFEHSGRPEQQSGGFPPRRQARFGDDFGGHSRGAHWNPVGAEDSYATGAKQLLPSTGWRRIAARKLGLPVGKSARELETDGWASIIRRPLRGSKVIGVLSGKGGVGKSSMAMSIASLLAMHRLGDVCLVTVNHDDTLLARTFSSNSVGAARPGVNLHDFATDPAIQSHQDIEACLDVNAHSLKVMGYGLSPVPSENLTPRELVSALNTLKNNFRVVFVDFGNTPTEVYWQAIALLDEMILVSSTESDSMFATRAFEARVRDMDMGDLVDSHTVGIINHRSSARPRADLGKYAGNRGALNRREVVEIPWDEHLAESGPINLELVGKTTYRHLMLATAAVMRTLPS